MKIQNVFSHTYRKLCRTVRSEPLTRQELKDEIVARRAAAARVLTLPRGYYTGHGTEVPGDPAAVRKIKRPKGGVLPAIDALTLALLQQFHADGESVFISGTSVSLALSMLAMGATGQTYERLAAALGLAGEGHDDAAALFKSVSDWLVAKRLGSAVAVTNRVDVKGAMEPFSAFKARTAQLRASLAFERTHGTPKVELFNRIDFNGRWSKPFYEPATQPQDFVMASGKTVKVPMMRKSEQPISIMYTPKFAAVSLSYGNDGRVGDLSFLAFLPMEQHTVTDVLTALGSRGWPNRLNFKSTKHKEFGIPRFTVHKSVSTMAALRSLGYPIDDIYLGMGASPMFVERVDQEARIEVDEIGARAFVETRMPNIMACFRPPEELPSIIFDAPFVFAIADMSEWTKSAILFAGIYEGPE